MKINHNTKVTISLVILIPLLVFIAIATATAISWKASIDYNTNKHKEDIKDIKKVQDESTGDIIEIKTDIKWIRKALEILIEE